MSTIYLLGTTSDSSNRVCNHVLGAYEKQEGRVNGADSYKKHDADGTYIMWLSSGCWHVSQGKIGPATLLLKSSKCSSLAPDMALSWSRYVGQENGWAKAPNLRCTLTPAPTLYLLGATPESQQHAQLGAYDRRAELVNGMFSYVKQDSSSIMMWHCGTFSCWMVGHHSSLGKDKGVIASYSTVCLTPDRARVWEVSTPGETPWTKAPNLRCVVLTPPAPTLYLLGLVTGSQQHAQLGAYDKRAELVNGMFSYVKQGSNDSIMMWHADQDWIVGTKRDLGQTSGYIASCSACLTPDQASVWQVSTPGDTPWTKAPNLRCVVLTPAPTLHLLGATPEDYQQAQLGAYDKCAELVNGMFSYVKQGSNDSMMMWHTGQNWAVGGSSVLGKDTAMIFSIGARQALTPDEATKWEVSGEEELVSAPQLRCMCGTEAEKLAAAGEKTVYIVGPTPDGLHRSSCGAFERVPAVPGSIRHQYVRRADPSIMLWWVDGFWIIGSATQQGSPSGLHAVRDTALVPEDICSNWSTAPCDIQRDRGKLLEKKGWLVAAELQCVGALSGERLLEKDRERRAVEPRELFSGLQELSHLRQTASRASVRDRIDESCLKLYEHLLECSTRHAGLVDPHLDELNARLRESETCLLGAWDKGADERASLLKERNRLRVELSVAADRAVDVQLKEWRRVPSIKTASFVMQATRQWLQDTTSAVDTLCSLIASAQIESTLLEGETASQAMITAEKAFNAWERRHSAQELQQATENAKKHVQAAMHAVADEWTELTSLDLNHAMGLCAEAVEVERSFIENDDAEDDFAKNVVRVIGRAAKLVEADLRETIKQQGRRLSEVDAWQQTASLLRGMSTVASLGGPMFGMAKVVDQMRNPISAQSLPAIKATTTANRSSLQQLENALRDASDEVLTDLIAARDHERTAYVRQLMRVEAELLLMLGCTAYEDAKALTADACESKRDMEATLAAAMEYVTEIGTAPDGRVGMHASAVVSLPRAACDVALYVLEQYHTRVAEWRQRNAALLSSDDSPDDDSREVVSMVTNMIGFEASFTETGHFPRAQLLNAAQIEVEARVARWKQLDGVLHELANVSAERQAEEEAAALANSTEYSPAVRAKLLDDAKKNAKKSHRALRRAEIEMEEAVEDQLHGESLEAVRAALNEAKAELRSAEASLKAAHDGLIHDAQLFPELCRLVKDAAPAELLALFVPDRTLQHYQQLEPLPNPSRHRVMVGDIDGRRVVIKEIRISEAGKSKCYKEALLLHRLRHPSVMPIDAIFAVTDGCPAICLQLPFYSNGTLADWYEKVMPTARALGAVLLDLCQVVAHLHAHGVFHCDIKPQNVLMTDSNRPVLADFDISVGVEERATQTLTMRGTEDFIAPELRVKGAMPSAATDAFSLGRTLMAVVPLDQRTPELHRLIVGMCPHDPTTRLLASAAVNDPYFAPLFASEQLQTCCICMDESRRGVSCAESHFTCAACITNHVHHACIDELQARRRREGRVLCPKVPRECNAPPFLDADLARHLDDAAFSEYAKSRELLIEARKDEEQDEKVKAAVEAERRRIAELSARQQRINQAREKIVEEVLTMRCPAGHPYMEFDGCCALRCGRCGVFFCAWCLKGSVDDQANHTHVAHCPEKPANVDAFYPNPRPVFDKHWTARKTAGLQAELVKLHDESEIREILDSLAVQLQLHNIALSR